MRKVCDIQNCTELHEARGWCHKHYAQWRKAGDPISTRAGSLVERFERKYMPVTESGCWIWVSTLDRQGYGSISVKSKPEKAHRVSWRLQHGPIPGGLCVLHKCDIPACVNPSHLFLGSYADNNADMKKKGRAARQLGESNGKSKLTVDNVREIKASSDLQYKLAKRYGVSRSAVAAIKIGRIWRHIVPCETL